MEIEISLLKFVVRLFSRDVNKNSKCNFSSRMIRIVRDPIDRSRSHIRSELNYRFTKVYQNQRTQSQMTLALTRS